MTDEIPFIKMHGLGNDFVIFDSRSCGPKISSKLAQYLGDRHFGIGFDQMVLIHNSSEADLSLTFLNSDGSKAGTCGNATRCVAQYEMERLNREELDLRTDRGILKARQQGDLVSINMGHPLLEWCDIPLSRPTNTLKLPIDGSPTATGMGNPHCTFFVHDADVVDLQTIGPEIEKNSLFPEGTNVQIAHVIDKNHLRMRVWERGVGITLASGSSSCATAVAAARLRLTEKKVTITLDGGDIFIEWREDGVWMTGATMHVFNGTLTRDYLESIK